ncbi:MAG: type II toxin-antitoxin system VapB family antitoxin [Spirochaetaceae bacterium]|nr:type II toxin-antitoxin system VapB family antitoxin [Spirochaetaceae bacterium]
MKTTIDIPRKLLEDVKRAAKIHTNREAVTVALEEFLRHHRSAELVDILGTFSDFIGHDALGSQRGES